jgi:hypothetical protein
MNRALRSFKAAPNAVMTEGALAETGRRSRVSIRYQEYPSVSRASTTADDAQRGGVDSELLCDVPRRSAVADNSGYDIRALLELACHR